MLMPEMVIVLEIMVVLSAALVAAVKAKALGTYESTASDVEATSVPSTTPLDALGVTRN